MHALDNANLLGLALMEVGTPGMDDGLGNHAGPLPSSLLVEKPHSPM